MGFDAIWISPVVDNTDGWNQSGTGYHGYWARDWSKLNDHFGTPEELKSLVEACHERDILVMVDVVANHVGPVGMQNITDIYPFNNPEHYHPNNCQMDFYNQTSVEWCWLYDLPDLAQEKPFVREYLKDWVKDLVETYGFDGLRIDTARHVPKDFLAEYGEAAGVFQMGEVSGWPDDNVTYLGEYQPSLTGMFNFPLYDRMLDVFGNGTSMESLSQLLAEESEKIPDLDALGIFMDNHDNDRFLEIFPNKFAAFRASLIFAMTQRGIPFFYYGSE